MDRPPDVKGLHHYAYRCKDAEETRHFYEDILGLPLVHFIREEFVPSTGEYCPYVHIFFQMTDGSYIAFFDLGDDVCAEPSSNTPNWVNHIALKLSDINGIQRMKSRLESHGVPVVGITDHHIIKSIYFFDPNGIRVEFTTPTISDEAMRAKAAEARPKLEEWTREKARRRSGVS